MAVSRAQTAKVAAFTGKSFVTRWYHEHPETVDIASDVASPPPNTLARVQRRADDSAVGGRDSDPLLARAEVHQHEPSAFFRMTFRLDIPDAPDRPVCTAARAPHRSHGR